MVSVMLYPCILCVALLIYLFILCVACLNFDKYGMCCSLLYQFNSVLQSHIMQGIVTNLSSFFPCAHP